MAYLADLPAGKVTRTERKPAQWFPDAEVDKILWTRKQIGGVADPPRPTDEPLHQQHEWLRVTLSSTGDGVITIDNTGSVTFLNPVAQSLTGYVQDAGRRTSQHAGFNHHLVKAARLAQLQQIFATFPEQVF